MEITEKFGKLFPEDNILSPLMLRLAIISNDLRRENDAFNSEPDQISYCIRKISITLDEAYQAICELPIHYDTSDDIKSLMKVAGKQLKETHKSILNIRNQLGAHIGAKNTICNLKDREVTIKIDPHNPENNDYKDIAIQSIFGFWESEREAIIAHNKIADDIKFGFRAARQSIYIILIDFWKRIGVLNIQTYPVEIPENWPQNIETKKVLLECIAVNIDVDGLSRSFNVNFDHSKEDHLKCQYDKDE